MKKTLIIAMLAFVAVFAATQAFAQFNYNFSRLTQTYTPLTAATSVNKGRLWSADTVFNIPIGFNFKLAGNSINSFSFSSGNYITGPRNTVKQSGFMMLGTGLMDRGYTFSSSKSDIRYLTTGTAPNRVFKLEIANAGFEDEYLNNGELKDSISLQVWMYEGSNIMEFRYGSSMVSDFNDYFGGFMRSGFIRNVDTATGVFEKYYVLNEKAGATVVDSMATLFDSKGLGSVPASGTVFRFTPKSGTTAVQDLPEGSLAQVYPTQFNDVLTIEQNNAASLSYTILNINGQMIAQGTADRGKTSVDLSSAVSGTYLIRLVDAANNRCETRKLIRL